MDSSTWRDFVVDGYLRLEPTAGSLGSMPIPQGTLDNAVKRLFDSPENREKFRVPPHISDIRVEGRQIEAFYNQERQGQTALATHASEASCGATIPLTTL